MGKKDKDKKKRKHGETPDSLAGPATDPEPDTRRSSPAAPDEVASSKEGAPALEGEIRIPPLRPLSIEAPASGSPDSHGGYDVGDDTNAYIAPIGPTEYAGITGATLPSPPPDPSERRAPPPPPSSAGVEQLEQQIRDLEARLDSMIGRPREAARSTGTAAFVAPAPITPRSPQQPAAPADAREPAATARELLPTDFYLRQWGRSGMRKRAEEVDEFGLDPSYEARFLPFFDFLYKTYFRVEAEGTENIPDEGRCLLVSNHSGGPLPYDGIMLRTTVRREHARQREVRWLAEDFVYYLPFVGAMMNRLGAVRACQENAERLLAGERLVAVFPEGAKGIGKLYRDRYRLQRFGRGGFIRLCLRTETPIVPCAIVGAEEANPMLYRIEYMTKMLGIPYLPITPTFPALGPLGLLPAPTKWRVRFGEPIAFDGYGPEAADDDILVGRLAERVRATIQSMLDRTLASRRSVWFG